MTTLPPHAEWAVAHGLDADDVALADGGTIWRVASVQRSAATGLGPDGDRPLGLGPSTQSGTLAVGDWVTADETGLIIRILPRRALLQRRAAGVELKTQLICANVDTLFITTSCNADFNPARLERYLALALDAGVAPVILLTKPDLADAPPADYATRARALSPALAGVVVLDARAPDAAAQLAEWLGPGQTVAFVGSSGVGKSTLLNTLTDGDQATAGVRKGDQKGRHTTTSRSLLPLPTGGWVIDMPGMREIGLHDVTLGIERVFADLATLAEGCRFRDCTHLHEPGCALLAGVAAGTVDPDRLARWQKLRDEDALNAEIVGKTRAEARRISRTHRKPPSR
jgi:ribosome biogenesis GTPase